MKVICSGATMEPIVESTLGMEAWREMALKAGRELVRNLPDPRLPISYELAARGYIRLTIDFVLPEEGETP